MAKKITKKAAAPAEKADKPVGYTATDLAAEFGIEPSALRVHLRATDAKKPEGGRWEWPKKNDAGLETIRKAVAARIKELAAAPAKDKAKPAAKKKVKKAAASEGDGSGE